MSDSDTDLSNWVPSIGTSQSAVATNRPQQSLTIAGGQPNQQPTPDTESTDLSNWSPTIGKSVATAPAKDQEKNTTWSGALSNIGAGTSEFVAGLAGLPVDLATAGTNLGIGGINYLLGTKINPIAKPVGGSEWWKGAEGVVGADPRNVTPATPTEELLRAGARGATAMAVPGLGAAALPEEAAGLTALLKQAGEAGARPSGMMAGATGAVTGQAAADRVAEPYKGLADFAGNLVGGGVTAAAENMLPASARAVRNSSAMIGSLPGKQIATDLEGNPIGQAEAAAAGQRIAKGTGLPPEKAQLALAQPSGAEYPEGFQPSLGQETGNMPLLSLEKDLRNKYNALFNTHAAANNSALLKATGQLSPEAASDIAGTYIQSHLDALRSAEDAEPLVSMAQDQANTLGGNLSENNQSDLGAQSRQRLEMIRGPVKQSASAALDAVDPDRSLALYGDNVAVAARGLLGQESTESPFALNPKTGETLAAAERPVLTAATQFNGVVPFQDLRGLLGQVSAAQRAIRSDPSLGAESRPYARMRELRQSIEDSMVNGAAQKAAEEISSAPATQPSSGELSNWGNALTAERDNWYADRANAAQTSGDGATASGNAGARQAPISGPSGAAGTTGRGSSGAAGVSPVSTEAQPLEANFDAEDAARLQAANRAYTDYKQRFRTGPVGRVLASGNTPQGYRLGDSEVVANLFRPGVQGGEAIDSLIAATGSPEAAMDVLGDYPAYSLRRAAEKNGVIDPKLYQKWESSYKEALDRLEPLRAKFADAATASQEAAESAQRWQEMRKMYENSAARYYLKNDPEAAIGKLMAPGNGNAASDAKELMKIVSGNPLATASVQRNTIDWILNQIKTTQESGTTGERELAKGPLQRIFEKQPAQDAALKTILGPEKYASLKKISDAMDMAARSFNAVAIKGSPGTASDLIHNMMSHDGKFSLLAQMALAEAGVEMMKHFAGITIPFAEEIAPIATAGLNVMRANGIERVDQLAAQGVLKPELGRLLVGAAAKSASDPRWATFARQLGMLSLSGEEQANTAKQTVH